MGRGLLTSALVSTALALWVTPAMANTKTLLGCGYEGEFTATHKPRDCFLAWPNLSNAEAAYPRKIKWKRWGRSTATGTARHRVKLYEPWTPVTLKAFRRRPCGPGVYVYTRVQVTFPTGKHTWRTPSCADINPDD